ncbi:MAG: hypothetical protein SFV24_03540, partial [Gemmatimonadales bacterium]|nr:hypothetical protein [Gemmatimonadales bacterium]
IGGRQGSGVGAEARRMSVASPYGPRLSRQLEFMTKARNQASEHLRVPGVGIEVCSVSGLGAPDSK